MDVFLMGSCRFIIGTTSGLTTAAQAFGTPMLLANTISNDDQFWPNNVDFIPKRIRERSTGRVLGWKALGTSSVQGLLVSSIRLRQKGYEVLDNGPEEIDRAVAGMLSRLSGEPLAKADEALLDAYRAAIGSNPAMYGNASPAVSFLRDHPEMLA